ncbi:MAG: LysR family transcriptional regulator [Myxococcales bacterium]
MGTIDLNLVRAAVAVHESGSFSGAAARLGVPRSSVSRSVAALEDALGLRLFQRTTRKVATTQAGLSLIDRVKPALANLEAGLSDVPERQEEPSGTLRITATADSGDRGAGRGRDPLCGALPAGARGDARQPWLSRSRA